MKDIHNKEQEQARSCAALKVLTDRNTPKKIYQVIVKHYICNRRPSSGNFDSVLRGRYFPGGPTPEGLESDMMFKTMSGEAGEGFTSRPDTEEMMAESRWQSVVGSCLVVRCCCRYLGREQRMTPPESPSHSTPHLLPDSATPMETAERSSAEQREQREQGT